MKSRCKVLSVMAVVVLIFGVGGVALADNASQIDLKISYPYNAITNEPGTEAVTRTVGGDVVNIYITLLDANGDPATAGPAGEPLASVNCNMTSSGGTVGSININQFLSDSAVLIFDTPAGVGPVARAFIDYTCSSGSGCAADTDVITAQVSAFPDPIIGSANVNVVASHAISLVVRTFRNLSPPSTLFDPIPLQSYNQGGAIEQAGFNVPFTIIADDGTGYYTFAPNLEGQEVTVNAYADFLPNGIVGVDTAVDLVNYEKTPIATATATFVNGVAQGTIRIDNGSPSGPFPPLVVLLTARFSATIQTTQMTPAGIPLADPTVDLVPMFASSIETKILIGTDLYPGTGNLISEAPSFIVLNDGASGPTPTLFNSIRVDTLGNAVAGPGAVSPIIPTLSANLAAIPLMQVGSFDIAPGAYIGGAAYVDGDGVDNNGGITNGSVNLTTAGLTGDTANISLIGQVGGVADLEMDTDAGGNIISAGDLVIMTLQTIGGGGYPTAVDPGDQLMITGFENNAGQAQLLSSATGTIAEATTQLMVSATDADAGTPGIQVLFRVYGPCVPPIAPTDPWAMNFFVADVSKGIGVPVPIPNLATVADINPLVASFVAVTSLAPGVRALEPPPPPGGSYQGDPLEIISPFRADGVFMNPFLSAGNIVTWDEFGNVTSWPGPQAFYLPASTYGVPIGVNPTALTYPVSAATGDDNVSVSVTGVGQRGFTITNILASPISTAVVIEQEGPQNGVTGTLMNPPAAGEAIIRISTNGTMNGILRTVSIALGEGSVEGAQLRSLNGVSLPVPFTGTIGITTPPPDSPDDLRLVVSAPTCGFVNIVATDVAGVLAPATLTQQFCEPLDECEADFDCDGNVDADDVETFLEDFGRFPLNNPCAYDNPCNGDFDCDTDVDAADVEKFLEDFGRFQFNNPCPACEVGDWCNYASSCIGNCGNQAPAGCWCDDRCVSAGDCCQDACAICGYCP